MRIFILISVLRQTTYLTPVRELIGKDKADKIEQLAIALYTKVCPLVRV
jgi:hypothetical protein